jgi:hypothetical protein
VAGAPPNPPPRRAGTPRDLVEPRLARIAAREGLTAKRSRPEMALQRLEMIESALGNGMGSEASNPTRCGTRARLTARDSGRGAARMTRLQFRKGNFPPRNTLKSLKTEKESRSRRRRFPLPRSYEEGRGWGS